MKTIVIRPRENGVDVTLCISGEEKERWFYKTPVEAAFKARQLIEECL